MRKALVLTLLSLAAVGLFAQPVSVEFWHAMGGKNGEITAAIAKSSTPASRTTRSWPCTRAPIPTP